VPDELTEEIQQMAQRDLYQGKDTDTVRLGDLLEILSSTSPGSTTPRTVEDIVTAWPEIKGAVEKFRSRPPSEGVK